MAHKWAWCLHDPCQLGGPQRFAVGDKTSTCAQVGLVASYLLLSRGFRTLERGDKIKNGPQVSPVCTYITSAFRGSPTL